jgi:hypothetical protein
VVTAAEAFAARQYRLAYELVAAVRDPGGLYADAYWCVPDPKARMGSVAAVGVGLVSLVLADLEGWELDPEAQALATVSRCLEGLEREPRTGFFAHFFDLASGRRWAGSEYSTVDTALLVAGARLAGRHFRGRVAEAAERLFRSVAWDEAVLDAARGALAMVVDPEGRLGQPCLPFNEYAVLGWLAREAGGPRAREAWDAVFAPERLAGLPRARYEGVEVLTDDPAGRRLLSSFVHLFPFDLVPPYAESAGYVAWLRAAAEADRRFFRSLGAPWWAWGCGAGASDPDGRGYHADAVGDCPGAIASPHIVAGFLPVCPAALEDLREAAAAPRPPCPADRFGLHRYPAVPVPGWPPDWSPAFLPLVDHSTMLYGLAALRHGMGVFR